MGGPVYQAEFKQLVDEMNAAIAARNPDATTRHGRPWKPPLKH
jgi:hypothetical protein